MGKTKRARRSAIRKALRQQQGNRCCWCGGPMSFPAWSICNDATAETLEHLVPLSKGGADDITNMALSHYRCNQERGTQAREPLFRLPARATASREGT